MDYIDFLKSKQIQIHNSGFDIDVSELNTMLFDWQKDVVKWALRKGKACLFEDCGLEFCINLPVAKSNLAIALSVALAGPLTSPLPAPAAPC